MSRKPVFAAVSRTHDLHRLALLIRAMARSFFLKSVLSHAMLPSVGLDDPNQKTYPRIMKTPARLLTGHGKSRKANVCSIFFKRILWLGKILILPSILKLYPLKKIAARKIDFSSVGIESPCC